MTTEPTDCQGEWREIYPRQLNLPPYETNTDRLLVCSACGELWVIHADNTSDTLPALQPGGNR